MNELTIAEYISNAESFTHFSGGNVNYWPQTGPQGFPVDAKGADQAKRGRMTGRCYELMCTGQSAMLDTGTALERPCSHKCITEEPRGVEVIPLSKFEVAPSRQKIRVSETGFSSWS